MTYSRRININKLYRALIVFSVTVFLLIKAATISFSYVPDTQREYKTVVVHSGDTIWSIAQEYTDDDIRNKVKDIRKFNNLESDLLCVGDHIKVPLYD